MNSDYHRVRAASALTGDRVRNRAGEDLGKIEEIMIDLPGGRVAYAVIAFGLLDLGANDHTIPLGQARLRHQPRPCGRIEASNLAR